MADLLILIKKIFPDDVYGSFENYSIQKANPIQVITIEDYIFSNLGEKLQLPQDNLSILTLPDQSVNSDTVDDLMIVVEFALALLVNEGHPYISSVAIFSGEKCSFAKLTSFANHDVSCEFSVQLTGAVIAQWVKRCISAYRRQKN
ncbi:MAG: hypothetical protein JETCAE01_28490 [Anaerolineaceae bacterium]|nr:MAG: hypothetical protein JETCAE01_28490 [Anaerolineaceae bacterium]